MTDDTDDAIDEHRLTEDILMATGAIQDAHYQLNRYRAGGYEHRAENAVNAMREARDLLDEAIERADVADD